MDRKKGRSNNPGYRPLPRPVYKMNLHPKKKRSQDVRGVIPKIMFFFSAIMEKLGSLGSKSDKGRGNQRQRRRAIVPIISVVALLSVLLLITGLVRIFTAKNAYTIYLGEKKLGVMAMTKGVTPESLAASLFDTATTKLEGDYGAKLQVAEKVSAEATRSSKKDMVTSEYILSEISKNMSYKVQAAIIIVDGIEIAILKNQNEADAVLKMITSQYINDDADVVSEGFVEDVSVELRYIDKEEIVTSDIAYKALIKTQDVQERYLVKQGDTLWGIANRSGMSLDELLIRNPDIHMDSVLFVGQELFFNVTKPVLSVKIVEKETYTEVEPMQIKQQENAGEYITYSKVIQKGEDGEREVTVNITKINGVDTGAREIVNSKIIVEPVTEIREVGTSQAVPKR